MSDPTETRLRETYRDVTPPDEMREELLRVLPEIPRVAPAPVRRPVLLLAVAAAAAVLVIATVLLLPGDEPPEIHTGLPAAPGPGAREFLGDQVWNEFLAMKGGMARLRYLRARGNFENAPPGPAAGRELADLVMTAFSWREIYVGREHQNELSAIRDFVIGRKLGDAWSWLFVRMAEHPHPDVRLHGIQLIHNVHGRSHGAPAALARALGDTDSRVRGAAFNAIVDLDMSDQRAALLARLKEQDDLTRMTLIGALAKWTDPETRAAIVAALGDEAYRVRSAAATSLERQGAKDALGALRAARRTEKHGDVARVLDSSIRSLATLRGSRRHVSVGRSWTGPDGAATEPEYWILGDHEPFAEAWQRHRKPELAPVVDYDRNYVLLVCAGPGWNSRGYDAVVTEDDARVTVRLQQRFYQTMGKADRVNAYLFLVLPLTKKPVVIEENVQGTIGADPIWKERAVLDPR